MNYQYLLWILYFSIPFLAHSQGYEVVATLKGHEGEVQNIRFSPDGKYLASGGQYGKLLIWDVEKETVLHKIEAHKDRINDLSFHPSGNSIASASYDGLVKVWGLETGALLHTFENKDFVFGGHGSKIISFVAFSPTGTSLIFGGDGGGLLKANVGGNTLNTVPSVVYSTVKKDIYDRKVDDRITGGAWALDGASVVISARNTVLTIEVSSGKCTHKMTYPREWLNDVVVGPKEGQVSVWSEDGILNIWDIRQTKIIQQIQAGDYNDYCPIAYSSSGDYAVTGASGKKAHIWNVATGDKTATLEGHTATVRVARFSPKNPELVATGSYDGSIKLWKPKEPVVASTSSTAPPALPDTAKKSLAITTAASKSEITIEEIEEGELAVGKTFNLKSIQFEQGDHRLLSPSQPVLNKIIKLLHKYPQMEIQIEGHTDNMGDAQKNLTLSHRRVTIVRNYMLERGGFEESRIKTQAFGESKPIASNDTEATRQLNRRVEVRILKM